MVTRMPMASIDMSTMLPTSMASVPMSEPTSLELLPRTPLQSRWTPILSHQAMVMVTVVVMDTVTAMDMVVLLIPSTTRSIMDMDIIMPPLPSDPSMPNKTTFIDIINFD